MNSARCIVMALLVVAAVGQAAAGRGGARRQRQAPNVSDKELEQLIQSLITALQQRIPATPAVSSPAAPATPAADAPKVEDAVEATVPKAVVKTKKRSPQSMSSSFRNQPGVRFVRSGPVHRVGQGRFVVPTTMEFNLVSALTRNRLF